MPSLHKETVQDLLASTDRSTVARSACDMCFVEFRWHYILAIE